MTLAITYPGDDLLIFQDAKNWKSYIRRQVWPFLGARVLEVGAGIGATTVDFPKPDTEEWVCLEPDPNLADTLQDRLLSGELPPICSVKSGSLQDLADGNPFDTILYIDVLEHIQSDDEELARAARLLNPGGHLVVMSPAHQFLFSKLDSAAGHVRRYTRNTLLALTPDNVSVVRTRYLDSIGMFASLANRHILDANLPTMGQLRFWDRVMVGASRISDPLLFYTLGKSILVVWRKSP